jgi:hypothetical protein
VKIAVTQKGETQIFQFNDLQKYKISHPFSFQSHVFLFPLERGKLQNGYCSITCTVRVRRGRREQTIINDNFATSSKLPFSCFLAQESLPGYKSCSYGDLHAHSQFSQSHVEFGPPIEVIDVLAKCYGADFTAVTDHSYDLACSIRNYLKPDQGLERWKLINEETSRSGFKTAMLLGEEISCLNSNNKAVHLCGFGVRQYIRGTVDGARKNTSKDQQVSIDEAIALIHKQEGVAFAAHPGSRAGFMQRIFLKRGIWKENDIPPTLDGFQAVNNGFGRTWHRAKALWIKELLKGKKISLIAGNDAHGDFNRYRYLSIPFVQIKEMFDRYYCAAMTGTYEKVTNQRQLIDILKKGSTFVTTGPMLCISSSDVVSDCLIGKNQCVIENDSITLIVESSEEFGEPRRVRLYWGSHASGKEQLFFGKYLKNCGVSAILKVPVSSIKNQKGYLRAEAECEKKDGMVSYSATSPVFY